MNDNSTRHEPAWTDDQRRAALCALADRFHMHLTEQDVFHAAALFFGLLQEGVFIDKAAIARRMQNERARAEAHDDENERPDA